MTNLKRKKEKEKEKKYMKPFFYTQEITFFFTLNYTSFYTYILNYKNTLLTL